MSTDEKRVVQPTGISTAGCQIFLEGDIIIAELTQAESFIFREIPGRRELAMEQLKRCPWGDTESLLERDYHDGEWGKRKSLSKAEEERYLFEMLTLEGAQAGLSWATVLKKRENYKKAFDNFDLEKVAGYDEYKSAELLSNPGIIRNRLKVASTISNAQKILTMGSLSDFIWGYVDGTPILNHWENMTDVPATSALSDKISKDMKKLGFSFVGSTIIYSFLQAIGVINDHLVWCDFR